jgi:hypothetical protein
VNAQSQHGAHHHHPQPQPADGSGVVAEADRASITRRAAINTAWCLLSCSIGDVGVVVLGRNSLLGHSLPLIFALAILAGLATSLAMEIAWLWHAGQRVNQTFQQAQGMSLLSIRPWSWP